MCPSLLLRLLGGGGKDEGQEELVAFQRGLNLYVLGGSEAGHHGKAQACASLGASDIGAVEALEQAGQMLRRDGLAGVVDGEDCLVSLGAEDQ